MASLPTPPTTSSPSSPSSSSVPSVSCTKEADFVLLHQAILDIKDNLTSLTSLLTSHAVLEEQVSVLNREMKNINREMDEVRLMQARASGSSVWVEKICWGLVALALGAVIGAMVKF